MTDLFKDYAESLDSPPSHMAAVTPSDDQDLATVSRGINVAGEGAVRITTARGETAAVHVAAGIVFPIRARKIWATGTTATGIVALY